MDSNNKFESFKQSIFKLVNFIYSFIYSFISEYKVGGIRVFLFFLLRNLEIQFHRFCNSILEKSVVLRVDLDSCLQ